jgi:hypothetical protein
MEALARARRRDYRGGRARGLQLKLKQQLKLEQRPGLLRCGEFPGLGDQPGDRRRGEGPADGQPA